MVIRIALWSHDSVGLGHVRRNLAIAHALADRLPDLVDEPVTGILVTGQSTATSFPAPAGWDWVVLPSLTVGAEGYSSRHLATSLDRVTRMRGDATAAVLSAFGPDLLIVDRHPFGVRSELTGALSTLRAERPGAAIVLGLRDVLDRAAAAKAEWRALGGAASVRHHYDAVWVYGDPDVHDVTATHEVPRGLHPLVRHTGYLSHGRVRDTSRPTEPLVLTTVGGGSDGLGVAEAAARAVVPAGHRHIVVTGPQMSDDDAARVRAAVREGTTVLATIDNLPELIHSATAVVSMGGYNTVCEIMGTTTPALVVPRVGRRDEQRIRVAALERTGAIESIDSHEDPSAAIAAFFARSVGRRCTRAGIDLDGLAAVAPLARSLLHEVGATRLGVAHAV